MDIERTLSTRLFNNILENLSAPAQNWLNEHPLWHWFLVHPLWLLGMILLLVLLLSGLVGAIAHLTERIWLNLLSLPFKLSHWLWQKTIGNVIKLSWIKTKLTNSQPPQSQLADILNRLEALKQEQEALLKEAKQLLKTQEIADKGRNATS